MKRTGPQEGSGTILAVGIVGAVLLMACAQLLASALLVAHARAAAAADAAALAAADTASGRVAGVPCVSAGRAARRNGAALESCRVDGLVATVRAHAEAAGLGTDVEARAGPPREAAPGRAGRSGQSKAVSTKR